MHNPQPLTQAGCFKVGHKVFRGKGNKALTITALMSHYSGTPHAKLNQGVWYPISQLWLAGPSGTGEGA